MDLGSIESGVERLDPVQVIALTVSYNCQALVNQERFYQEKTGWYLLPRRRLTAWYHPEFEDSCTTFPQFRPAAGALANRVRQLTAWIDRTMPRSGIHARELYGKGYAYAVVDRIDDAKEMLARGDAAFDATSDRRILTREGLDRQATGDRDALRGGSREELVRAIAEAEARASRAGAKGAPPP